MIELQGFKDWLISSTDYSQRTVSNIVSRLKRADNILSWYDDEVYLFRLEKTTGFQNLSVTVKSQIKKSVKLYFEYVGESQYMERTNQ